MVMDTNPGDLQFQRITTADISRIKDLQPEGWSDIVPEFEYYIKKEYCFPIKVILGDTLAGVGTIIVLGKTAWLAHIIVDTHYRNRSIGYQITQELLRKGYAKSVETHLLIATEQGIPVYLKSGFRKVSDYQYFKREHPWKGPHTSRGIKCYHAGQKSKIFEIDEAISGENRRKLLAGHLKNTVVYTEGDGPAGFYMQGLGEGMILADTEEAGLALMRFKYAKVDKAVLPSENHKAIDFLLQNGFKPTNTMGTRMILGNEIKWKPECIYSRIGGNFG